MLNTKLNMIALIITLVVATPAMAGGGHYGHGHWHGGGGGNWVAPFIGGAIVGGVLGGAIVSPYAPYYAAPTPYYAPSPYQPYYRWDCDAYDRCGWVWR